MRKPIVKIKYGEKIMFEIEHFEPMTKLQSSMIMRSNGYNSRDHGMYDWKCKKCENGTYLHTFWCFALEKSLRGRRLPRKERQNEK